MKQEERVLKWVNRERKKLKMRPIKRLPKGVRGQPDCCTLALALKANVHLSYPGTFYYTSNDRKIFLPAYVSSFVRGFDKGLYPHLSINVG